MSDLTTQVLIEIRDEARKTNAEVAQVRAEVAQTNSHLERLERRQTESEIRISIEIVTVAGAIDRLTEALLDPKRFGGVTARLDDHERRLETLERR